MCIVWFNKIINKMDVEEEKGKGCGTHGKEYGLIGNEQGCDLNCLMCCDCLGSLYNGHKMKGINHKTISIESVIKHFEGIGKEREQEMVKCKHMVNTYIQKYSQMLMSEVRREKERLYRLVENIMLTEITKEEKKLQVIQKLYGRQYEKVTCKQVSTIDTLLLSHQPKQVSVGYENFMNYISKRELNLTQQVQQFLNDTQYNKIVLRECSKQINYPYFGQQPQTQPSQIKKIKTQQSELPSPKRTHRRSLKKNTSLTTRRCPSNASQSSPTKVLNNINIKLKKPLQFYGSEIIRSAEDVYFIQKLFNSSSNHRRISKVKKLYLASESNFSVTRFHQYCDGQINTIVLAKTEFNKVIGGYTALPWKSSNNTLHSDIKKESFLFSLSLKQKMNLLDQESAIFNSKNYGPTFGGGADLAICHNANTEKTSYSEFPYSYGNSRYMENSQHCTFMFTGQQSGNHFYLKEWEVWKVYFMDQ